ncbi:MAG: hypothetical protein LLG20_27395, partial [Acidobacteriales bacterium]|nr:hypothetical protein [Terriglobales bacterium]
PFHDTVAPTTATDNLLQITAERGGGWRGGDKLLISGDLRSQKLGGGGLFKTDIILHNRAKTGKVSLGSR